MYKSIEVDDHAMFKELPNEQLQTQKRKKERKPWRATTAYEIFCEQERPNLKTKMLFASSREINKTLGIMWTRLSKKEKSKYEKLA